jgi:hypothetical protein
VAEVSYDVTTGFAAMMKTFVHDPQQQLSSRTLHGPMVALAAPDPALKLPAGTSLVPKVFLRNATGAPLAVTGKLLWYGGGASGSLSLGRLTLLPGATQFLDLTSLAGSGKIPAQANWGTVLFSYSGRSGDLVPISMSQDRAGRFSMQTPFSEGGAPLWKGSMWHVGARHDTLLVAGNAGDRPATTALTLIYNGGKGTYTMKRLLQPGEQMWADVGSIISSKTPDINGSAIPAQTTAGSYEVRDLDDPIQGQVYEGKLVLDKTYGHAAYGCGVCCGYSWAEFAPTPYVDEAGNGTYDIIYARNYCTGDLEDVTYLGFGWGSNNTSVAKVTNGYTSLVAVGTTDGFVNVTVPNTNLRLNCPDVEYSPTQGESAFAASLSCSPSPVTRGSTVTCAATTQVPSGTSPVFSNWKFTDG